MGCICKFFLSCQQRCHKHPQIIYGICQGVRISARHIQQSVVTMHLKNFPFLTWGNESVDAILNAISCKIPKDGPIQRISVQHNGVERISYLVASVGGPMLIKSVSDLDGLQITPNGFLSAPDIAAAKQALAEFLDSEQDQVLLAKKSEQENQKYAGLQEGFSSRSGKTNSPTRGGLW